MRFEYGSRVLGVAIAAWLVLGAGQLRAETGVVKGTVSLPAGAGSAHDVVVYLEGAIGSPAVVKATVDQKDMTFIPHVMAVTKGSTVEFLNSDPALHNVFSTAAAKKFDLGMFGKGESRTVTFDTPGVVDLRCNVHPKMLAFIVVTENNFFAVPDDQGAYQISGVPPGRYKLRAWHEKLPAFEIWVDLAEAKMRTVDIRLK